MDESLIRRWHFDDPENVKIFREVQESLIIRETRFGRMVRRVLGFCARVIRVSR